MGDEIMGWERKESVMTSRCFGLSNWMVVGNVHWVEKLGVGRSLGIQIGASF